MTHELVTAFAAEDLTLSTKLQDMLNEQPQHRTERRGCGLTQATRLLAEHINGSRSPTDTHDLSLFPDMPQALVAVIAQHCVNAGWPLGWRNLAQAPQTVIASLPEHPCLISLVMLPLKLAKIANAIQLEESHLILNLMTDILAGGSTLTPHLTFMKEKPEIGSCSQAEEFFLEIAHGKIRRGGHVNILVDASRRPILIEKMHLGESHSAIFLEPVNIGGVQIPPGGLAALHHEGDLDDSDGATKNNVLPLDIVQEARFLRLTTLSVTPKNRQRAFSAQFMRQTSSNMLSPATTTIDDLRRFANHAIQAS